MHIYSLYGFLHRTAKKFIACLKGTRSTVRHAYFYDNVKRQITPTCATEKTIINDEVLNSGNNTFPPSKLFYGENSVINAKFNESFINEQLIIHENGEYGVEEAWMKMLNHSVVPPGFRNSGFHSTGYIREKQQYCLASWIWTSAAVARCYIAFNEVQKARAIADAFLREQLPCGGWIVRFDFSASDIIPMVAPNDSAYIATNCLIPIFSATGDRRYFNAALKCAEWIIDTANEDGLVKIGYDNRSGVWIEDVNIVDIGFTGGLFAEIFTITKEQKYREFLDIFSRAFIKTFFNYDAGAFATSVNKNGKQQGGFFGRGQGWAREGLIPAYHILRSKEIEDVINLNTNFLLDNQLKNGAWPYNFRKRMMGEDCKGAPIIARTLLDWYEYSQDKTRIVDSAKKALDWCAGHTRTSDNCIGGIFSYCIEGAIVHDLYTETAFTYSSAYALEVRKKIAELSNDIYS